MLENQLLLAAYFLIAFQCVDTDIRRGAINGQWGLMEINGDK